MLIGYIVYSSIQIAKGKLFQKYIQRFINRVHPYFYTELTFTKFITQELIYIDLSKFNCLI